MRLAFLFTCGLVWAQNALERPQIGVMIDASGTARGVYGVSASVTLGDPMLSGVLSSACSDSWCIFKTADAVVVNGQPVPAPAGPAIFAIDGANAAIYFPGAKQLAIWQNGQLTPVETKIDGQVVGLRSDAGVVQFAVRRRESTWIVDETGAIVNAIAGATGPVMLLANGILYADGDQVVLRRVDASELRFDAPGALSFSGLGLNYVQIRTRGSSFALRVDAGHERIFELPEPAP